MKALKIYMIVFILFPLVVTGQFEIQKSVTDKDLSDIFFIDVKTGYITGDSGVVLKTVNGGRRWIMLNTGVDAQLNSVAFINKDTGFVAGEKNTLLRTTDGGKSWEQMAINSNACINDIQVAGKVIYAAAHSPEGAILLSSRDNGNTWSSVLLQSEGTDRSDGSKIKFDDIQIVSISFIDELNGILTGYSYTGSSGKHPFVCKTVDGGKTFTDITPYADFYDEWYSNMEFVTACYVSRHSTYLIKNNALNGFMYSGDYLTESFDVQKSESNLYGNTKFKTACFLDRYTGYLSAVINGEAKILKTIDMGESFIFLDMPVNKSVNAICFADEYNVYFVGENGAIMHLTDENNVVVSADDIYENDPPFAFARTIKPFYKTEIFVYNVFLSRKDDIEVVLCDKSGNQMDILRWRKKIAKREICLILKTENLKSGIYYYTVKVANKPVVNGKMSVGVEFATMEY